jgi:hypothetical protein
MKPTVVDSDRLATAAREVKASSDAMARGLFALKAAVTGGGEPWGADEQGRLFGQVYVDVRQHAMDAYDSHVGLLTFAADNLTTWADEVRETEDGLTRQIDRFASGLSR